MADAAAERFGTDEQVRAALLATGAATMNLLASQVPESMPDLRSELLARAAELATMGGPVPLRVLGALRDDRR